MKASGNGDPRNIAITVAVIKPLGKHLYSGHLEGFFELQEKLDPRGEHAHEERFLKAVLKQHLADLAAKQLRDPRFDAEYRSHLADLSAQKLRKHLARGGRYPA